MIKFITVPKKLFNDGQRKGKSLLMWSSKLIDELNNMCRVLKCNLILFSYQNLLGFRHSACRNLFFVRFSVKPAAFPNTHSEFLR